MLTIVIYQNLTEVRVAELRNLLRQQASAIAYLATSLQQIAVGLLRVIRLCQDELLLAVLVE
jgi:hypothetical protein